MKPSPPPPGPVPPAPTRIDSAPASRSPALGEVVQVCRDCGDEALAASLDQRCAVCRSPRLVHHRELSRLTVAHLDCDAFYASVEKRDRPALADRPVIIGGGRRGVVAAACYVARLYGVRSAMPMFKALDRCPDAVVLKPDMRKYTEVGRAVRQMMQAVTPRIEPLSIDEAFLDLSPGIDDAPLAGRPDGDGSPARALALLARRIEDELGISVSIGLAPNKFLAKLASDLDKPRGFSVIGAEEAQAFLADKPVSRLWGVGAALQTRLRGDGLRLIGDITRRSERALIARYGEIGRRLWQFAHGRDDRRVHAEHETKSISAETTFEQDLRDAASLQARLWPLIERVANRLAAKNLAGNTVVVKAKTAGFRTLTRHHRLAQPTRRAGPIADAVEALLGEIADGTAYRLIGVGVGDLVPGAAADPPDLFAPAGDRSATTPAAPGNTGPGLPFATRRLPLFAAAERRDTEPGSDRSA